KCQRSSPKIKPVVLHPQEDRSRSIKSEAHSFHTHRPSYPTIKLSPKSRNRRSERRKEKVGIEGGFSPLNPSMCKMTRDREK
ncbi:Hypothetical protein FKW44_009027, partial [Caligus rogercresseyi]